ncbi:hypothetical protein Gogos_020106 [Gossypium gossypioides]|uniref:CCHC-type domain-containing protein n=1 Tax=Gossypium gossypioides TaxID=34282 RepID=A0A7J9D066_GOSGO|nr:hypothetical protein [Gossypium gossypioides]
MNLQGFEEAVAGNLIEGHGEEKRKIEMDAERWVNDGGNGSTIWEFLETFLEYDTLIPMLGFQKYMRIKVKLDVSLSLKWKKKILMGNDRVFYARFQYEKLSLFCFICGKLGHRESFCPISVRIDLSKITFGWDISLCAMTRRRITLISRWLRKADGSVCRILDKESGDNRCNGKDDRDMRRIWRDDLERLYPNPNYIPLVPRIEALNSEVVNQQNMVNGVENWATNESRPMDLILE